MPDRKRKLKILMLHAIILPPVLFGFYFFTLAPQPRPAPAKWPGVDDAVVEKVAREHGRDAKKPLLDLEGDARLFVFLGAGAVGGFAAGYFWRRLTEGKRREGDG